MAERNKRLVSVEKIAHADGIRALFGDVEDAMHRASKDNGDKTNELIRAAMDLGRAEELITLRDNAGLPVKMLDGKVRSLVGRLFKMGDAIDRQLLDRDED